MKSRFGAATACVGAVIGVGFASGREITSFFTRYGGDSWWLILLSCGMMAGLSWLCMRRAISCGAQDHWCSMLEGNGTGALLCMAVLLSLTGGAMLSAAGELAALAWRSEWAYSLGAAGTMVAAWLLGGQRLRMLGWVSGVLMVLFVCAMILAMRNAPESGSVMLERMVDRGSLAHAAVRAAAYAAMNIALAISVVCQGAKERPHSTCLIFGELTAVLLYIGNALYLRHPEVLDDPFPIVQVLRCFGMGGFRVSVILLWLATLTSLTAVLRALDSAMGRCISHPAWRSAIVWCMPMAASKMGFSEIVDHLYAPAGALCLLLVFAPLLISGIRSRRMERNA